MTASPSPEPAAAGTAPRYGTVSELIDPGEKSHGINRIMLHYSGREWEVNASVLAKTRVWRLEIDSLTGKRAEEKAT